MLTTITAGPHSVRGISVGGVYTSLAVPELGLLFDAGASPRSLAATDTILLSHGHADHVGALPALLGIRGLSGKTRPPRVIMPAEIAEFYNRTHALEFDEMRTEMASRLCRILNAR